MIPRRLQLDFRRVPIHWARNKEFSIDLNATSPIAAQTEPYLNTVMAKIRRLLPPRHEQLRRDIEIFVKQEANHYTLHNKFNIELYTRGYRAMQDIELELRADFRELLDNKSLAFNAAYCAGFENLALFLCKFIFLRAQRYFVHGEPRMVDLFLWHYAEEFEHRAVAHDVFTAFSSNYFLRIYGALYAFLHLARYKARLKQTMLDVDRAGMTAAEAAASRKRESAFNREMALYVLPRMLAVFIPFYDPRRTKMPANVRATLDRYASVTAGNVAGGAAAASDDHSINQEKFP